ncbi:inositol polyphosphate-5-phosphatase A isoform X4 [Mesoplodon densirostris]|uniref:inositol polyphosphate-5-phosphatase A isoform X4 n=1 Tax=Mesoplodon densirostris TaxID=48708 RepID=UPI0028DBAD1B|nr:inositol polyphosphate-5-phosphatase A isoform X4 [Mesoplodon densirostris]
MAGKAAAPGTAVLLVTANVGSLFDDPENLQKNWLREFYQVVHTHRPHFLALHCQEFGGKNYEASMSHVDKFVRELLSSDAMKEYNRARVYLDENYKSQEHFTALGSFYFLHESLKNISQFDFKAKKYKKVTGKEIYSDTLESTPMLEKEKFPQDYFPECKWSRKGFVRTRWCLADCAFDLVNIHLFHDASNLVAWETSPSVYSGIRHKALGYVLDSARALSGAFGPRGLGAGPQISPGPRQPAWTTSCACSFCARARLRRALDGAGRPGACPRAAIQRDETVATSSPPGCRRSGPLPRPRAPRRGHGGLLALTLSTARRQHRPVCAEAPGCPPSRHWPDAHGALVQEEAQGRVRSHQTWEQPSWEGSSRSGETGLPGLLGWGAAGALRSPGPL